LDIDCNIPDDLPLPVTQGSNRLFEYDNVVEMKRVERGYEECCLGMYLATTEEKAEAIVVFTCGSGPLQVSESEMVCSFC